MDALKENTMAQNKKCNENKYLNERKKKQNKCKTNAEHSLVTDVLKTGEKKLKLMRFINITYELIFIHKKKIIMYVSVTFFFIIIVLLTN